MIIKPRVFQPRVDLIYLPLATSSKEGGRHADVRPIVNKDVNKFTACCLKIDHFLCQPHLEL